MNNDNKDNDNNNDLSIIKTYAEQAVTTISKVVINEIEESKTCYTKIKLFIKKFITCECESSSNCIKNNNNDNKK